MVLAVDILLTLSVYWCLLAPRLFSMGSDFPMFSYGNFAVHTFTPLLMIFDYLFFNKRRVCKFKHVFLVLVLPFAYAIFAIVLGLYGYVFSVDKTTGREIHYPYFFLDIDLLGPLVIALILALTAVLIGIGSLCYLLDQKSGRNKTACSITDTHVVE